MLTLDAPLADRRDPRRGIALLALVLLAAGCGRDDGVVRYTPPDSLTAPADAPPEAAAASATGSATLAWSAPTASEDGSALADLAGYRIHYGTEPERLDRTIDVGNVTTHRIDGLAPGTYYFAVSAYDRQGNESPRSALGMKTVD